MARGASNACFGAGSTAAPGFSHSSAVNATAGSAGSKRTPAGCGSGAALGSRAGAAAGALGRTAGASAGPGSATACKAGATVSAAFKRFAAGSAGAGLTSGDGSRPGWSNFNARAICGGVEEASCGSAATVAGVGTSTGRDCGISGSIGRAMFLVATSAGPSAVGRGWATAGRNEASKPAITAANSVRKSFDVSSGCSRATPFTLF